MLTGIVSALWYWGYTLNGVDPDDYVTPRAIMYVVWPLAVMSFGFAYLLFFGLPEYYRQVSLAKSTGSMTDLSNQIPPYVPNFFRTLFRRKLVIWFLVAEVLRNYWLSGPYGRNWSYLWSAAGVPQWAIVVEIAVFFVGVWGLLMGLLIREFRVVLLGTILICD